MLRNMSRYMRWWRWYRYSVLSMFHFMCFIAFLFSFFFSFVYSLLHFVSFWSMLWCAARRSHCVIVIVLIFNVDMVYIRIVYVVYVCNELLICIFACMPNRIKRINLVTMSFLSFTDIFFSLLPMSIDSIIAIYIEFIYISYDKYQFNHKIFYPIDIIVLLCIRNKVSKEYFQWKKKKINDTNVHTSDNPND